MLSPLLHARNAGRGLAVALVLSAVVAGCATSSAFKHGRDAERRRDYDRAVVEYTKALRQNPDNADARMSLDRAKLRASQDHFNRARRFAALGKLDQALVEYEVASELNPTNSDIDEELRATRIKLRAKIAVAREGKTELQTIIERARDLPPPGLDLPPGVKMPATLTFRDAASRDVFTAIARLANISLIFDSAFRDTPVTVDLRNATLDDALNTVAGATRTFFRVTAPKTVAVIPDTPAKRREYEEEVVRTFYLSNADLKETMDLLRMVLDARRISPTTATNALTIKDTPERIAAAARVLSAIDKARPEVIIDVELLEVDRTRLLEYGLQIASPANPPTGLNGSIGIATGLPTLYYRLLKSDSNTRTLANPQLRTIDGVAAPLASVAMATEPFRPVGGFEPAGEAICSPYSSSFVRSTSSSSTSMITSGRALSIADSTRAAAAIRSGVSLIVSALVAVVGEMRRASSTMRSRSIVSLRSALLK